MMRDKKNNKLPDLVILSFCSSGIFYIITLSRRYKGGLWCLTKLEQITQSWLVVLCIIAEQYLATCNY